MVERRMESDDPRGGLVIVAIAVVACLAFVLGAAAGAAGMWVTR